MLSTLVELENVEDLFVDENPTGNGFLGGASLATAHPSEVHAERELHAPGTTIIARTS